MHNTTKHVAIVLGILVAWLAMHMRV